MKKHLTKIKNILIPFFLLSALTGIFTGCLIFAFKIISSKVISHSVYIYVAAKENPILLIPFFLCLALLGTLSYFILKIAPDAKG